MPNAATVIRDTWSSSGARVFTTARQFYQMFQNPAPSTTFTVAPLRFTPTRVEPFSTKRISSAD
jgi:hypothetical protein